MMSQFIGRGLFFRESNSAGWFQYTTVNFRKRADSLPVCGSYQLGTTHQFSIHMFVQNAPIANQEIPISLHELLKFFMPVNEAHEQIVDQKQSGRADQSPRDRVIVSYDCILHRI